MQANRQIKITKVVAQVIQSTLTKPAWDTADSPEKVYFYQLRAAHLVGISEPFTLEQEALNSYLYSRQAGKKLCEYAWRQYAQSIMTA